MRRSIPKIIAGLSLLSLVSACQLVPSPQPTPSTVETTTKPLPSSTASSAPLSADGRTMPWPKEGWVIGDSPDRQLGIKTEQRPKGFVSPPPGKGLQRYLDQNLNWSDCDSGQCAEFAAPLDYENPDGEAITIKIFKKPAKQQRSGALFVNPGGPGGSAAEYARGFRQDGIEGYDIIGMDSRGSGESTPVVCGDLKQMDAYFDVDASPDDETEKQALIQTAKEFAKQCRANSGALLDHITTIETIYDYDLARQLLGEEKLNFFGVSYGTYLGSVYAQLYPQNVGRMVLDSAVNLIPDDDVIQAQGFDLSMRNFATWCAEASERKCPLGNDTDQIIKKIADFFTDLDANPIPVGDRMLTQTHAVNGTILYFYAGEEVYSSLGQLLEQTIATRDGELLLQASDAMNDRRDFRYGTLASAFPAIRCVDGDDRGIEAAFKQWQQDKQKAPLLAPFFGPDVICAVWTAKAAPSIKFDGKGAPPILVLGNTGDSATPYQHAERMAQTLESAVLLTREGPGHGVYRESACISKPVNEYLNNGSVPAPGLRCPA